MIVDDSTEERTLKSFLWGCIRDKEKGGWKKRVKHTEDSCIFWKPTKDVPRFLELFGGREDEDVIRTSCSDICTN